MTTRAANDPKAAEPLLDLALPIAKIRGEPVTELPADLYIPPEALSVFLEAFEGPLDLLLYLIRRHSLDILDIPMAELTRQYMEYVEMMRTKQLELAAARLDALPVLGRDFLRAQVVIEQSTVPRFPDVHADELRAAWADILRRAKLNQHHTITREQLSVREHMSIVLRRLQGRRFVEFEELFDPSRGTPVLVVTFIALLELARERLLEITQAEAFAPIYVRLAYEPS